MLTFVIVVCFQLNLIAEFMGVPCRDTCISESTKKTYKKRESEYASNNENCEHEQASTRLNVARKSSKGQILRALENFNGPLDTLTFLLSFAFIFQSLPCDRLAVRRHRFCNKKKRPYQVYPKAALMYVLTTFGSNSVHKQL